MVCDNCKGYSEQLYHIFGARSTTLGAPPAALKVCKSCIETFRMACIKCHEAKDVILADGLCVQCRYSDDWAPEDPNSLRHKPCKDCSRYSLLSSEGICRNCHIKRELEYGHDSATPFVHTCDACDEYIPKDRFLCSNCTARRRECTECGSPYIPHIVNQYRCDNCLPRCSGCQHRFVPEKSMTERFCFQCLDKKSRGICVLCDKKSGHLDHIGHCPDCHSEVKLSTYICTRCDTSEVDDPREICEPCRERTYQCPLCKEYSMDYTQIICNECQKT